MTAGLGTGRRDSLHFRGHSLMKRCFPVAAVALVAALSLSAQSKQKIFHLAIGRCGTAHARCTRGAGRDHRHGHGRSDLRQPACRTPARHAVAAGRRIAHLGRFSSRAAARNTGPTRGRAKGDDRTRNVSVHRAEVARQLARRAADRGGLPHTGALVRILGLPLELLSRHLSLRARQPHSHVRREYAARRGDGRPSEGNRQPLGRGQAARAAQDRCRQRRSPGILPGVVRRRRLDARQACRNPC